VPAVGYRQPRQRIRATYRDGVLIVRLPKAEGVKPKEIKIRRSRIAGGSRPAQAWTWAGRGVPVGPSVIWSDAERAYVLDAMHPPCIKLVGPRSSSCHDELRGTEKLWLAADRG
jgi:hypothetical protein